MTTVGFVGPLPPIRSGIAQHSAQLLDAMLAAGHDVVAHSWARQYPWLLYRRAQMDPEAEPYPDAFRRLRWWDPTGWYRVGRSLRSVDRLVMPWTVPVHAGAHLAIMAAARVPTTLVVHNVMPHEPMPGARAAARAVLGRADLLVTHAESEAERCREVAPDTPVTVVPMPALLTPIVAPLPDAPTRLLCQGFIRDYKGFDVAVRALPALIARHPDLTLTIAGEPWDGETSRWHGLVRACAVEDHVRLHLGYLADTELTAMIADHHIVLAPYRSATQSGVVNQALAAGRPVVATRVGGLPDTVEEGRNGMLAAPDDVASLVAAIDAAVESLAHLAEGALASATSWDAVAAAVLGPTGAPATSAPQAGPNAAATSDPKRSASPAMISR